MKKKDLSMRAYLNAGKYRSKSTTPEQREIVRTLYNRINKRIKNVAKNKDLPQTAVKRFNEKVKGKLKNLDNMSRAETNAIFNELDYIEHLKSSTISGAKRMRDIGIEIMGDEYKSLNKGKQAAMWELANKMKEQAELSGDFALGSLHTATDVRVAQEEGLLKFERVRDSKGRLTSDYNAYFVDKNGQPLTISEFNQDKPIDLTHRDDTWLEINKTRNARLLKGF